MPSPHYQDTRRSWEQWRYVTATGCSLTLTDALMHLLNHAPRTLTPSTLPITSLPQLPRLASPCLPPVSTFFLARTHFHEKGCVSTNPILSINDLSIDNNLGETVSTSATPHLPSHGQALAAHIQAPGSCRRSPLAPSDGPSPCIPFLSLWPGFPPLSHLICLKLQVRQYLWRRRTSVCI